MIAGDSLLRSLWRQNIDTAAEIEAHCQIEPQDGLDTSEYQAWSAAQQRMSRERTRLEKAMINAKASSFAGIAAKLRIFHLGAINSPSQTRAVC